MRVLTEQITATSVFSENTLLKFQGALDSGKGLTALFDSIDRLQSSQRGTELAFTSAVAELTKSGPAIAWRNSLLAQHYVDFGIKPALGLVDGVLVGKLAGVSEQARMLTSWAARYEALPNLISPLGAEAVAAWRGQVLALPEALSRLNLGRSGAWDDLSRRSPAAAVKAATCMIEVLDRVLRAAAPDAAVVACGTRRATAR
ncbi:hypothetical protein ACQPW3_34945 [Actinosynnema sp. CA-248983]